MFRDIELHDPAPDAADRPITVAWWSAAKFDQRRYRAQRILLDAPGRVGYARCDVACDGEIVAGMQATADALWHLEGQPHRQYQLLRAAVLFEWVGSSRRGGVSHSDSLWPRAGVVRQIYAHALAQAGGRDVWQPCHCRVVPGLPGELEYGFTPGEGADLRDPLAFSQALDAQVGLLLTHWRLVAVRYTAPASDPFVAYVRRQEAHKAQQVEAESVARQTAQARVQAAEIAQMRVKHPRYGEWAGLSREELERLLWSKPRYRLAQEFGVSDTRVKQDCLARGISLPPPAHWFRNKERRAA